ncbi:hypothetical protein FNF27_02427 [Cafeteria roenbergensis]|uniref:EGF-like domain-containing protein n=1 Tax=Cafeteria roenbergensis TaxID=33653 RepID=A0A5A8EDT4_CAFRO|nr:hypothetical protein FNF29_07279 [Cafeteria roenbergensis]KAA0176035.1 hypothetical protein FNF27_02427 [Cafeteria roenbergensis]|eukprot:KAA0147534.1 hypothetical protein FNF29_07279 [Cafeteria roenbergensis]
MLLQLSILGALGVLASASCPGMCSAQGKCGENDVCECDRGFFGADCSLRRCPSGPAIGDVVTGDLNHDGVAAAGTYVDVQWSSLQVPERMPAPDGSSPSSTAPGHDRAGLTARRGVSHFPAECSGRGSCDYSLGQCLCSDGFEGSACQRRHCGDEGCVDEVQRFEIAPDEPTLFRFALASWEGQDRHALVSLHTGANGGQGGAANAALIEHALGLGIADHELERIAVTGAGNPGSTQEFQVTFVNNPGNHPLLSIEHVAGPARVVPGSLAALRDGTRAELECSGRGICDELSGLCRCFEGFGREDCASQMSPTALLELKRAEQARQKRKDRRKLERARREAPDGHARLQAEVDALSGDAGGERLEQASFVESWGAEE